MPKNLGEKAGQQTEPGPLQILRRKAVSAVVRLRAGIVSQRFGFTPSAIYDDSFYDGPGCEQSRGSAAAVARLVYERLSPKSVFDFGCGHGALIEAFGELGVEAAGCDGSRSGVGRCATSGFVFQQDLKKRVWMNRRFDVVTCIEVAEHLPKAKGPTLVDSIAAAAAKYVVFSASGPGEAGDDHINLRPPKYWVELFAQRGFGWLESESIELRAALSRAHTPRWLQNIVVLERDALA